MKARLAPCYLRVSSPWKSPLYKMPFSCVQSRVPTETNSCKVRDNSHGFRQLREQSGKRLKARRVQPHCVPLPGRIKMIYLGNHKRQTLDAYGAWITRVTGPRVLEPSGIVAHGRAHRGETVPHLPSLGGDGVWTRHSR